MNNLSLIVDNDLLKFEKEGDFFFLQIFQRRKDNPDLELSVKRVKSYCVYSLEELYSIMPKVEGYCHRLNARAYLRLNKQNALDVTMRCIEQMSKNVRQGNVHKNRTVWDAISGQEGANDYWLLDVDCEHFNENMLIVPEIRSILKEHFETVRKQDFFSVKIDTKSGVHIIVKPFDSRIMKDINKQFQDKGIPKIQIQKDCNTLLYTT